MQPLVRVSCSPRAGSASAMAARAGCRAGRPAWSLAPQRLRRFGRRSFAGVGVFLARLGVGEGNEAPGLYRRCQGFWLATGVTGLVRLVCGCHLHRGRSSVSVEAGVAVSSGSCLWLWPPPWGVRRFRGGGRDGLVRLVCGCGLHGGTVAATRSVAVASTVGVRASAGVAGLVRLVCGCDLHRGRQDFCSFPALPWLSSTTGNEVRRRGQGVAVGGGAGRRRRKRDGEVGGAKGEPRRQEFFICGASSASGKGGW